MRTFINHLTDDILPNIQYATSATFIYFAYKTASTATSSSPERKVKISR
ncbi:MAG: hypothetical protein R2774_09415 [Saprospiraceae bacterium]